MFLLFSVIDKRKENWCQLRMRSRIKFICIMKSIQVELYIICVMNLFFTYGKAKSFLGVMIILNYIDTFTELHYEGRLNQH